MLCPTPAEDWQRCDRIAGMHWASGSNITEGKLRTASSNVETMLYNNPFGEPRFSALLEKLQNDSELCKPSVNC